MPRPQIMVVEDEKIIAMDIQNSLTKLGYDVKAVVASGEEAIQKAATERPDLVLMDIMLEGEMDGVQAAEQIRERFNIPIVYLTAYADDKTLQRAKQTGPFGYAIKPFAEKELHSTIEVALYKHKMEAASQQANQKLSKQLKELERRNHEITLLNEMGHLLQSCSTVEDACAVVAQFARQLFPMEAGMLYLFNPLRNLFEAVVTWGAAPPKPEEQAFTPDACLALRRGEAYWAEDAEVGSLCRHVGESPPACSLCVPRMAQGDVVVVLHLQNLHSLQSGAEPEGLTEPKRHLAVTVAEHIALALSNLKLLEKLRGLSISDPLTGLFNRRYMEESLKRELRRAKRMGTPVGIVMLDLDHFKQFNDTFGHEVGDALLRDFGALLMAGTRGGDVACRYGNEEFVIILPGASLEDTYKRAEQFRKKVKRLHIQPHSESRAAVNLSAGVAIFPDHGATGEAILQTVDAALHRAKAKGRDLVVIAQN